MKRNNLCVCLMFGASVASVLFYVLPIMLFTGRHVVVTIGGQLFIFCLCAAQLGLSVALLCFRRKGKDAPVEWVSSRKIRIGSETKTIVNQKGNEVY